MRITYSKVGWLSQIPHNTKTIIQNYKFHEKSKYTFYSQYDMNKMKKQKKKQINLNKIQIDSILRKNQQQEFQVKTRKEKPNKLAFSCMHKTKAKNQKQQNKRIQSRKSFSRHTADTQNNKFQSKYQKIFNSSSSSIIFTQNDLSFQSSNSQQISSEQQNQFICDKKISQNILFHQQSTAQVDQIFKKIKISDLLKDQTSLNKTNQS